jgi:Caspase domain
MSLLLLLGDEGDGYDEILIPGDYKESGQIVDDWIFSEFVKKIAAGVHVVAVIDCCHSGTAMDLPYVCNVGDTEIRQKADFTIPASGVDLKPKKAADKKKKKDKAEKSEKKKKKSSKKASEDADMMLEVEEEPVEKKSKKSKKKKSKSDDDASE